MAGINELSWVVLLRKVSFHVFAKFIASITQSVSINMKPIVQNIIFGGL